MSEELTVADFFCGAGGFTQGFEEMGFDVVFALDNWGPAIETHKKMHPETEHKLMDIKEIETAEGIDQHIPDVDVIVGGPPCQNFSRSNKAGKADKTEGLNLIECMLRIIAWKKEHGGLKYWALENVPPTANHLKDEYTWEELNLPGEGENLKVEKKPVHNSADYGAPQARRRMVAGNYPDLEQRRTEENWRTVKEVFEHLKNPLNPEEAPEIIEDPNRDLRLEKEELTDHFYDTRLEEYRWKAARRKKEDHGYMGKMSFPEDIDRPSRTVMATRSGSTREAMIFGGEQNEEGGYENYRLPTVREIATFMAYPLDYKFEASTESKKFRLVGNSVPVKLSSAVAEAIAKEEDIQASEKLKDLPDAELENELTGKDKEFKDPRRRREDSKFDRHVPYLKTKAFRPSLHNQESDFEEDEVRWEAVLHKGVGKRAEENQEGLQSISKVIERGTSITKDVDEYQIKERMNEFMKDIREEFNGELPKAYEFQRIYTRRSDSEKLGPHAALDKIRDLVDEHFPQEEFDGVYLDNSDKLIDVSDEDIPVRIAAGFYGTEFIAQAVNDKGRLPSEESWI